MAAGTSTPIPYSYSSRSTIDSDHDDDDDEDDNHNNHNNNNNLDTIDAINNNMNILNIDDNLKRFRAPNQIPFISENISTHSVNSVSSYPSILALKLSFTNQASNEAISILSRK